MGDAPARTVSAAPEAEPRPLGERVAEALERARVWLAGCACPDGSFALPSGRPACGSAPARVPYGESLLAAWALLHASQGKPCPGIGAVVASIDERAATVGSTYSNAIALCYLATLRRQRREAAAGGWPANAVADRGERPNELAVAERAYRMLRTTQSSAGRWGYGPPYGGDGDVSNTQFAVLGLLAAQELGVARKPVDWGLLARGAAALQWRTGAEGTLALRQGVGADPYATARTLASGKASCRPFSYAVRNRTSGSTTAGALAALGVAHRALAEEGAARDASPRDRTESARDGFCWIQRHWKTAANPTLGHAAGGANRLPPVEGEAVVVETEQDGHHFFFALKCACEAWGVDRLGEADWYASGAEHLLSKQARDGSWPSEAGAAAGDALVPELGSRWAFRPVLVDTALAVLFLAPRTTKAPAMPTRPSGTDAR